MIIFNEGNTPERQNALFVSGPTGLDIPAVVSSFAVGNELYQAYLAGENPTVSLAIDADINDRFFPQVLAETKTGDPKNAVVVGAHLDSVEEGPGINDDGSGTSAQLEIAKQIARKDLEPRQQIRFAWWGGEEDGLIGSTYYAEHLNPREVAKIMVMLDFDMIASANFARLVYDGDGSVEGNPAGPPGSGEVERVFADFWQSQGLSSEHDPVRRSLRLRRVHQPRHPGRRHLRRRGGPEDARAGGDLRRRGGRAARPVLPRLLRPAVDHPRHAAAGRARRSALCAEDGGGRGAVDAPVPARDDATRSGISPRPRTRCPSARRPQRRRASSRHG